MSLQKFRHTSQSALIESYTEETNGQNNDYKVKKATLDRHSYSVNIAISLCTSALQIIKLTFLSKGKMVADHVEIYP